MTLKVIGAGLGRTGTLSLKTALEELGFGPCYHMEELILKHPEHLDTWVDALHGRPVDWKSFFQAYQATVDYPGCTYYQEFMALFPDAKVILTVRDPERWYESAYQTIYAISKVIPSWIGYINPARAKLREIVGEQIWQQQFGNFEDRQHAIAVFNRYNADVQQVVPAERLLVFEVKQGWEPLCHFLGVPVPTDKPFPHLNDTAAFRRRIRFLQLLNWVAPLVGLLLLILIVLLAVYLLL